MDSNGTSGFYEVTGIVGQFRPCKSTFILYPSVPAFCTAMAMLAHPSASFGFTVSIILRHVVANGIYAALDKWTSHFLCLCAVSGFSVTFNDSRLPSGAKFDDCELPLSPSKTLSIFSNHTLENLLFAFCL